MGRRGRRLRGKKGRRRRGCGRSGTFRLCCGWSGEGEGRCRGADRDWRSRFGIVKNLTGEGRGRSGNVRWWRNGCKRNRNERTR